MSATHDCCDVDLELIGVTLQTEQVEEDRTDDEFEDRLLSWLPSGET